MSKEETANNIIVSGGWHLSHLEMAVMVIVFTTLVVLSWPRKPKAVTIRETQRPDPA